MKVGRLNHTVGAIRVAFAFERVDEIVERFHRLALDALEGPRADVRSDDDFGVVQQWVVCGRGLFGENVGGITGEFARVQGGDDGVLVDEFTAAGVDDPRAVRKPVESVGIDAVECLGVEIGVWADDVHRVENRVE